MKAKVKSTGKIIEVTCNMDIRSVSNPDASVYNGPDGSLYCDTELDFNNIYPDWQEIKIKASIAAMKTLIPINVKSIHVGVEAVAAGAVKYANALVEELQKDFFKKK